MSDPEDMDFKDPKKWTQWDEMHFMSGDVSSILEQDDRRIKLPKTTDDLIKRHKFLSKMSYSSANLNDLIRDAHSVGITANEFKELLAEPLPANYIDAKTELRDRMVAFYNTVNRRKENIEVALSQGLLLWKRLVDYDRKIRKFHPKFLEYRELCLNADFKNIKESGFLEGQLNTWYDNVTRVLDEIDQSEIGKAISPRLNKQTSLEADTDNLRSVLDLIIKTYNKYHEIGEELIYRKIGWVQKETEVLHHIRRALELLPQIEPEAWDTSERKIEISDSDIATLKNLTGKFLGNIWVNNTLSSLRWRETASVSDLAALVSKSGKTGSIQAQAKAVKRKFRGLEPAGQIGLDYNEIEAKDSHYKDGTAFAVGDRIYTFIKGRTKFNTFEVLCYLHNKHQVEDTRKKLRSYFGRKPTPEEIAEKMELKVNQIGKYLG